MKRLKKLGETFFERNYPNQLEVLENKDGLIFIGLSAAEGDKDFSLYRWDGEVGWNLLLRHSGGAAEGHSGASFTPTRFAFDDPEHGQLIFTLSAPMSGHITRKLLLAVDYDGHVVSETFFSLENRSVTYVDRFPNGDYLLLGINDGGEPFVERLDIGGLTRWSSSRAPALNAEHGTQYALALPDATTALFIRNPGDGIAACHIELLDESGQFVRLVDLPPIQMFPLPQLRSEGDGWILETVAMELADRVRVKRHRFQRIWLDRNWQTTQVQEAVWETSALLIHHTFYPDGVLAAGTPLLPPHQCCWLPLDGSQQQVVFAVDKKNGRWPSAAGGGPPLRREDGSYVFTVSYGNDNLAFSAVGVSPAGEIQWTKPFHCEKHRYLFIRGNRLVVVLGVYDKTSAAVYELP